MKINKDSHLFTIAFTFLATIVLVFPLTLAFMFTKPIADRYWQTQHYVKTLNALGLTADAGHPEEAAAAYKTLKKYKLVDEKARPLVIEPASDEEITRELEAATMGNMKTFLYVTELDGQFRYAGNFFGPGLWGNVSLAVGVNADSSLLEGLQVLYQVETPGLGGRIGESWFTRQFTGLRPANGLVFNLSGQKKDNGMDAIAGATITSTAVKDIVNNRALPILKGLIARLGGNP